MEKSLLVTVKFDFEKRTWDVLERARELAELARTAGAHVVSEEICHKDAPEADLFIGSGKVKETAALVKAEEVRCVIFNHELTGTQQRNLERALGTKVVDRTQLILDIFARHAKSPEGKAQVELAQLEYMLPRLGGKGVELSRLGGGIGTRGPGEQKLEVDRRVVRDRITRLKRDLKGLEEKRETVRRKRGEVSVPTVVLVGYTSAGKSTLFNALTGSDQVVSAGLFTTLDPLMRQITLPGRERIVLSDTVGFIQDLPHSLVEAFKATLEEVVQADLLVHVVDASHPKATVHIEAVAEVLEEIGVFHKPTVLALNKVDLIQDEARLKRLGGSGQEVAGISALKRRGLDALLDLIRAGLAGHFEDVTLLIPPGRMDLIDVLYKEGEVRDLDYGPDGTRVSARLPRITARKLSRYLISESN